MSLLKEWSFWWKERRLHRSYAPLYKKIKKGTEEYEDLDREFADESLALAEQRRFYYQRKLINKARQLLVPVPQYSTYDSENWEAPRRHRGMLLTDKAIKELRKEVRDEQKARRDVVLGWITPVSGIIGTVIGFLLGWLTK